MIIDFDKIAHTTLTEFRGGENSIRTAEYMDDVNRIIKVTLLPGSSVGLHKHPTSSEVIFVITGVGTVICDGAEEKLSAGLCSYCPMGSEHLIRNDGEDEFVYYAVVSQNTTEITENAEEDE